VHDETALVDLEPRGAGVAGRRQCGLDLPADLVEVVVRGLRLGGDVARALRGRLGRGGVDLGPRGRLLGRDPGGDVDR
jgi:hypothetical protein